MYKKTVKQTIMAIAVFLSACGSAPQTSASVGPSAVTASGYQFDFYISPQNIRTGAPITATVTVWSAVGNAPAGNVTAYFSGDVAAMSAVTSTGGIATLSLTPSATVSAGYQGVINAVVENRTLSLAYNVTP